jgi:hypothetical protein
LRCRDRPAGEALDPAPNLVASRLETGLKDAPGLVEPWCSLIEVHETVQVGSARHTQSKYHQKTE